MELGIGTNDVDASSHIAKGKRTKRLRHLSPCAVVTAAAAAAISSSSSASEEEHGGSGGDYGSFSSSTNLEGGTDQEEEDMANCLILLAQGKRRGEQEQKHNSNKMREKSSTSSSSNNNNRRFSEVTTTTVTASTKIGFYVYECKTCNRTFPSFQALGGHRASHKKPKLTPDEKKLQPQPQLQSLTANCGFEETKLGHVMTSPPPPPPISLQLGCGGGGINNNSKGKVHECSICGTEFTSGQALGGHMRRHRASTNTNTSAHQAVVDTETACDNKPKNVLELDLNLPAPPEDDHHHRETKFHFSATHKSMLLSAAPPLVGCHY